MPDDPDKPRRRRVWRIAGTAIVVLVLGGVGAAIALRNSREVAVTYSRSDVELRIVLDASTTHQERLDIERRVESMSRVDAEYVSADEALRRAKRLFKESPGILENLAGNPFPASVEAFVASKAERARIAGAVEGMPGVAIVEEHTTRIVVDR